MFGHHFPMFLPRPSGSLPLFDSRAAVPDFCSAPFSSCPVLSENTGLLGAVSENVCSHYGHKGGDTFDLRFFHVLGYLIIAPRGIKWYKTVWVKAN